MRKEIINKVFLKHGLLRPEQEYYITCPDKGQTSDEFLAEYGFAPEFYAKSDYWLCSIGKVSDIKEWFAKSYVDLSAKDPSGHQLYKDYRYPNDTNSSISTVYASFATAVEKLGNLVGYEETEIIVFHT